MQWLLVSLAVLVVGGVAGLVSHRNPAFATKVSIGSVVLGCLLGLVPVFQVLLGGRAESVRWEWSVPYGSFSFGLDPLSAIFLLPLFGLSALAAIYGGEYLKPWWGKKAIGTAWFFYNLLVASMVVVVLARNGVLFIVAWEVMSLASFFLVTFEDERESVRDAGWVYLVATHLGTAFLFGLFLLCGKECGSLDFDRWGQLATLAPKTAGLLFVLAVIGFGTKAGFMPMHVWLPEAHPAAPSHVSALMSGIMIKMGIYGLFRMLTLLGPPPVWWAYVLVGIGLSSGILGVLFALAQRDIKRLLAYSSVENIGIIALGLGTGLLGMALHAPGLAILGLAGALFHVLNHACFKGLLFLGAGSVAHGAGTREMDILGGLIKRMPWTALTFLVGAAAISGLPPLNGFVSEFLVFVGSYQAATTLPLGAVAPALAVIAGLGLIGGLAAATFTKAFGSTFQGEPRGSHSQHAHEAGWSMRFPMMALATTCVFIGLWPGVVFRLMKPVLAAWPGLAVDRLAPEIAQTQSYLNKTSAAALALVVLIGGLTWLRRHLLRGRTIGAEGTWDCGYIAPTARMQYTASSFAQPLTDLFRLVLRSRTQLPLIKDYFPREASLATETPDLCHVKLYHPAFEKLHWGVSKLRWLQHGHVQLYVLYIALTLLILLVWRLG